MLICITLNQHKRELIYRLLRLKMVLLLYRLGIYCHKDEVFLLRMEDFLLLGIEILDEMFIFRFRICSRLEYWPFQ